MECPVKVNLQKEQSILKYFRMFWNEEAAFTQQIFTIDSFAAVGEGEIAQVKYETKS